MTIQEKISKLDDAIVKVESYLSYSKENGGSVKKIATDALQKIEAKNSSIQAVKCMSFPNGNDVMGMSGLLSSMDVREESSRVAYRTSVQAIINILKHERERLIKEQQDETQHKSLLWAKIAAFGSIASIIVSIILYLCKN